MRQLVMLAIGLGVVVAAVPAEAAVLCANPSGSVFVRATCKNNETTLDPAALGLVSPGVKTVAGFVYNDGGQFGGHFSVTRLSPGKYQLRFPVSEFDDFPAIAVSAWGIPGVLPTANVVYNIFEAATNSYLAEVWLSGADGSTPVDASFQFVAAQVTRP